MLFLKRNIKSYLLIAVIVVMNIILSACIGNSGNGNQQNSSSGTLDINLSESNLKVGKHTTATVSLNGSTGVSNLAVNISSSETLNITPETCNLSTVTNSCQVDITGYIVGDAEITVSATGYTSVKMNHTVLGTIGYANNFSNGTISMFSLNPNTGILTPLSSVIINTASPSGFAIDSSGKYAYVANYNSNSVSIYSRNTNTGLLTALNRSITTGDGPNMIALFGRHTYIANFRDNTISMYSIDPNNGILTPLNPSTIGTGDQPTGVVITPSGKNAYVINSYSNTVSMYSRDVNSGILTALTPESIKVKWIPSSLVIAPSEKYAYLTINSGLGTVNMYSINPNTGALIALSTPEIRAGFYPRSLVISPSGKHIYVTSSEKDNSGWIKPNVLMYRINPNTGELTLLQKNFATGNFPRDITIDPSGKYVYVCNEVGNTISMYRINPITEELEPLNPAEVIAAKYLQLVFK